MAANISEIIDNVTYSVYIENYSFEVKVVFILISLIAVTLSCLAATAMYRTKTIPYASKWLSSGLLLFDVAFILTSTIRKFVIHPIINLHLQQAVTACLGLSYITVGFMAVERYILFLKPMEYLNRFTGRNIRRISIFLWTVEACLNLFVRYGVCFWMKRSDSVFKVSSYCLDMMSSYYAILISIVLITSCTCYWKIFKCVKSKVTSGQTMTFAQTAKTIRSYRSMALVFVYVVTIIFTFLSYGVIILLIKSGRLHYTELRLSMETVSLCNCFLDPFLYVFWFKECRMYMLQAVSFVFKKYEPIVANMKMEIYHVPEVNRAFNPNGRYVS